MLRALARRLREASSRFSVLLLNDAVYLAEDPSNEREDAPIDWILLEEDSRGRGVQATHPVREVGYAEAVRLLFGAERVFQFP